MANKLLKGVLWLVGLAVAVLLCWLMVMYWAWPLWAIVPVLLALLVVVWLGLAVRRRWIAWRLRRKLARDMPRSASGIDVTPFDQQWKAGLQVLREARLGGRTASLYALPWILSIKVGEPTEDHDLRAQAIRRVPADPAQPMSGVSWYFLKSCVVLATQVVPSGADAGSAATVAWQRLLYRLLRTRRREPLNGIVFNIDVGWLQQASDAELNQAGQALRLQHDDLTRVFNARIPVWVVLTHADQIAGFYPWSQALDASLRDQPFGYTSPSAQQDDRGSPEFVRTGFASVMARLAELRLALGRQGPLSAPVFELPERISELQPRLQQLLIPSFDATPYAATPLLRGLYWTSTSHSGGVAASYFASDLYDHVFPLQRHTWQGLDRLGSWRRVLRHAAVAVWAGLGVAAIAGLLYSSKGVHHEINTIAARQLDTLGFSGSLEEDLQSLNIWHDATIDLVRSNKGVSRLLPFSSHLSRLEAHYKNGFVQLYKDEIKRDFMDQMVVQDLPGVARHGNDTQVAAWTQYLVRRMNMIRARLDGKKLDGLPLPGPELAQLHDARALNSVGLQTGVLIGQLYVDYLKWQPERAQLQGELDGLDAALHQLGLGSRSADWLLAWADFQNDLRAITLTDFWGVPVNESEQQIPAGLTKAGTDAITVFVTELANASGDFDEWDERNEAMSERFKHAAYDAWYQFMAAFDKGRLYLKDESAWRLILSSTFSQNDPYRKLLRAINELFVQIPQAERPEWVVAAINLEHVLVASELTKEQNTGLLDQARTANALGHVSLKAISHGASIEKSVVAVREGLAAVEEMKAYREQVSAAVKQLLLGQGSALELASQTWSYGHDAEVKESPLHNAQVHFERIRDYTGGSEAREGAVWDLLNGPLSFALDYTARSAACGLQQDWDATVLSAVQNVRSQILAYDLLYGERGSVPTFMQGTVQSFLNRSTQGFAPREALGYVVPLNGEFYSYIGGVQLKQVSHVEQQQRDDHAEKARAAEIANLQQQHADLEAQANATEALKAVVSIETAAPLVSPGATVLPQRTTLTLQCAGGTTRLENYNFPTSTTFGWTQNECADTTLTIQFPEFTLQKSYAGPNGFVEFLRDFSSGQRRFSPADFPGQGQAMTNAGVQDITLVWRIQGQDALLKNAEKTDKLLAELADVRARTQVLREQQAGTPPDEHVVDDVRDIVPERIASPCWQSTQRSSLQAVPDHEPDVVSATVAARMQMMSATSPPSAVHGQQLDTSPSESGTLSKPDSEQQWSTKPSQDQNLGSGSGSGPWYVQVGVFADPKHAQQQLDELSVSHDTVTMERRTGKPLYSVKTTTYTTRDEALSAAEQIRKGLNLSPQVLRSVH